MMMCKVKHKKTYREVESLIKPKLFVRTGEFREPKAGEFFLSGAIPEAYKAPNDLSTSYNIMQLATPTELFCQFCGVKLYK